MKKNRDDFSKLTVDILAKRVGYLCSNPDCRKHTVGPNDVADKATIIGIAAHITAAAPGGPRYDANLTADQRGHIDNGIWLCSNCSVLIDKDPNAFSTATLRKWRSDAEKEMSENIRGVIKKEAVKVETPFIEADLLWSSASRANRGYSPKNKEVIISGQDLPIIFWEIRWYLSLALYNNSKYNAYNVKVESVGDIHFDQLSELNKINSLPAFENLDLEAKYSMHLESTHVEADELLLMRIPKQIEGLRLKITYQNESRDTFVTYATIKNNEMINSRE